MARLIVNQIKDELRKRRVRVAVGPRDGRRCGEYDPNTNVITIFRNKWESPITTLIHEVLHRLAEKSELDDGRCSNYFLEEQQLRDLEFTVNRGLSNEDYTWFKKFLKNRGY